MKLILLSHTYPREWRERERVEKVKERERERELNSTRAKKFLQQIVFEVDNLKLVKIILEESIHCSGNSHEEHRPELLHTFADAL